MRLVFVHGIKHETKSSEWIIEEWLNALCSALSDEDQALLRSTPVSAPFYGDVLFDLTQKSQDGPARLTSQSAGEAQSDEAEFFAEALAQIAATYPDRIAAEIVTQEGSLVEQGLNPHNRHLIAVVRAIEAISPMHGDVVLRLLPQAFTYLNRIRATEAVDAIVRPELEKGPCIVVAHSLGTIVSFKLLRELRQEVPFYMTIGSPLAIKAVQKPLETPYGRRPGVETWLNAYDKDDFVTIGKPLNGNFGTGMDDVTVANPGEDAHSHSGYLGQTDLAAALIMAIKASG